MAVVTKEGVAWLVRYAVGQPFEHSREDQFAHGFAQQS